MSNPFAQATRQQAKLRLAIDGPSGAGKTYTALIAATVMAQGGKIAVIDTERGSASLYADKFAFDVATLESFSPQNYTGLIEAAEAAGYAVIVIDSLSHAWEGEGGALDMVDDAVKRSKSGNSFTVWKDVTPLHRRLVDAMLQSKCHIIATMRSKTDYIIETVERGGRTIQQPKKVGMAPIQRQGMEYEFTIVADMDVDHNLVVTKSRCEFIADAVESKPGEKFFKRILDWLNSGAAATPIKQPAFQQAGGNGKEQAKAAAPAQKAAPTANSKKIARQAQIGAALAMTTPKGTPLANLTDEQLKLVAQKGTNGVKEAASLLLSPASGDDWTAYYGLAERADKNKVAMPELAEGVSLATMLATMRTVQAQISEVEANIPAGF